MLITWPVVTVVMIQSFLQHFGGFSWLKTQFPSLFYMCYLHIRNQVATFHPEFHGNQNNRRKTAKHFVGLFSWPDPYPPCDAPRRAVRALVDMLYSRVFWSFQPWLPGVLNQWLPAGTWANHDFMDHVNYAIHHKPVLSCNNLWWIHIFDNKPLSNPPSFILHDFYFATVATCARIKACGIDLLMTAAIDM